jgi:hypothetical protein
MIRKIGVYETKGQQFPTIKQAIAYRENLIEKFLRKLPGFQSMPLPDRIAFVQSIIDNRGALIELMDYDDQLPDDED